MRGKSPLITLFVRIVMAVITYAFYIEQETQNTEEYEYSTQFFGIPIDNFSRLDLELLRSGIKQGGN